MFSDVLLAVDFDRTLTGPTSQIPARNIEAIEYFMANGGALPSIPAVPRQPCTTTCQICPIMPLF